MRLFLCELKKLWSKNSFLLYFVMLVCVNVFLMWMNSQTNTHTASPDAYRQLTSDMKYMGESEKVEYIQSRFDMISAVSIMDNIVKSSQYDSEYANKMMDREYKHLFDAYGDLYRSKVQFTRDYTG